MQIEFPDSEPAYSSDNLTLTFAAHVDGRIVPCAISVEALEDHFGAHACNVDAWRHAFVSGRETIEEAARQHLRLSNGAPILLKSGHFPPGSAFSVYRKPSIHARSV
ncbi:DUF1488 domain-containing protein [Pararobbsia alpina]|uniref:DUF1488 domain-containing protein n=1 Tax=Pararobbsia alpina TaxID=621374 RepID=UPI0039A6E3CF